MDHFVGRVFIADADILFDRTVKQTRILEDGCDRVAQRSTADSPCIGAIDQNTTGSRIEHALKNVDQRCLASACWADNSHSLARLDFE
ncbi:hypothetical protein D3C81_2192500 [compost metagenome]